MKRESRILWDPDDMWVSEELINDLVASECTAAMKRPGAAKTVPDGNPPQEWFAHDRTGDVHAYVARSAALPDGRTFVLDVFRGNQWHAHCTWAQFEDVVAAAWRRHCDARNNTPEQKLDELTQDVRRLEEAVREIRTRLATRHAVT